MSLGRTRFRQSLLKNSEAPGRYLHTRGAAESGTETRFLAFGANYGYLGQTIANQVPVWLQTPEVVFEATSTPQVFPSSGTYQSNRYVVDFDGDPITITKNTLFVQGVTWDGGKFNFDGTGSGTFSIGHILTANDGHGGVKQTNSFTIRITGEPSWSETTADVVFTIGTQGTFDLNPFLVNFDANIHSVQVHSSSPTLPSGVIVDSVDTTVVYDGSGSVEEDVDAVLEIVDDVVEDPGYFQGFKTLTITIGAFTSPPPPQPVVGSWATSTLITIQAGGAYSLANNWNGGPGRTNRFEVADGRDFVFPSGVSMTADGLISVVAGTANQSFAMKFRAANDGVSNDDARERAQFDERISDPHFQTGKFGASEYSSEFLPWPGPDGITHGFGGAGGFVGPGGSTTDPYYQYPCPSSAQLWTIDITAIAARWLENGRSHGVCIDGASGISVTIRSRQHATGPAPMVTYTYASGPVAVFTDVDVHAIENGIGELGLLTTLQISTVRRAFIHFPKPTAPLVSATLTMFLHSVTSGSIGKMVRFWLARPPFEDSPETLGSLKDEAGLYYYRRNPSDEPFNQLDTQFFQGGINRCNQQFIDPILGHAVTRAALANSSPAFTFSLPIWKADDFAEALDVEFEYWWYPEDTFSSPEHGVGGGLIQGGKTGGFSGPSGPTESTSTTQWRYTVNNAGTPDAHGGGLLVSPVNATNLEGRNPKGKIGTMFRGNGGARADGRLGWSIRGGQNGTGFLPGGPLNDYHAFYSYQYVSSYKTGIGRPIQLHHEKGERRETYRAKGQLNDANYHNVGFTTDFEITGITSTNPAVLSFSFTALPPSFVTHARTNDELAILQMPASVGAQWQSIGVTPASESAWDGASSPQIRIKNVSQTIGVTTTGTCELEGVNASSFPPFVADPDNASSIQRTRFKCAVDTRAEELWLSDHPTSTGDYLLPGEITAFNGFESDNGINFLVSRYGRGVAKRERWTVVRQRLQMNTINPSTPDAINFRETLQDPNLLGNWDGRYRMWIDGKLTQDLDGLCLRYKPPYYLHDAAGVKTEMGIARAWFDLFHGGAVSDGFRPVADSFFRIANISIKVHSWGAPLTPPLL